MNKCTPTDCNGTCKVCPWVEHYHERLEEERAGARCAAWVVASIVLLGALTVVRCSHGVSLEAIKEDVDARGTYKYEKRFVPYGEATGERFEGNCSRFAQEYVKALWGAGYYQSLTNWTDEHMWAESLQGEKVYVLDNRERQVTVRNASTADYKRFGKENKQ